MLDGFGCYPLCIEIDLDSYDGSWTHVARFRNRSGWLLVASATVSVDWVEVADYPIVVACDEYGEAIPDFMAPNLLACACSIPQLCDDFPPEELELQLGEQRNAIRKRWMRDTYSEFAVLDEQASRDIENVEGEVAAKLRVADRQIADMGRRRRMLDVNDDARSIFDAVIAEIETYQDSLVEWLAVRRVELRQHYEALEKKLSRKVRPHIAIEPLYQVSWIDGGRRSGWEAEDNGAYRHSLASQRSVDRVLIPPELASLEVQLAALRQEFRSSDVRDRIMRLNKSKGELGARLAAAKGD